MCIYCNLRDLKKYLGNTCIYRSLRDLEKYLNKTNTCIYCNLRDLEKYLNKVNNIVPTKLGNREVILDTKNLELIYYDYDGSILFIATLKGNKKYASSKANVNACVVTNALLELYELAGIPLMAKDDNYFFSSMFRWYF